MTATDAPALPLIDVCIATYKRPDGLRRLLRSILAQETGGAFRVAIHVADNDAEGSAESVIRELAAEGHAVSYGIEPTQSISLARNKSFSFARGDYVATTDDDLVADPRWLAGMYAAMRNHRAEVVIGLVEQQFPPGTPKYVRSFFARPNPPTGTEGGFVPATGNSMIRRAVIRDLEQPFDPSFGRTGGEDTDLFTRLRKAGCRLVWCSDGVVYEKVATHRANLRWILKRKFRYGFNTRDSEQRPFGAHQLRVLLQNIVVLCATSAAWAAIGVFRPEGREKARSRFVSMLLNVAFLFGRIARALNFHYEEYKAT